MTDSGRATGLAVRDRLTGVERDVAAPPSWSTPRGRGSTRWTRACRCPGSSAAPRAPTSSSTRSRRAGRHRLLRGPLGQPADPGDPVERPVPHRDHRRPVRRRPRHHRGHRGRDRLPAGGDELPAPAGQADPRVDPLHLRRGPAAAVPARREAGLDPALAPHPHPRRGGEPGHGGRRQAHAAPEPGPRGRGQGRRVCSGATLPPSTADREPLPGAPADGDRLADRGRPAARRAALAGRRGRPAARGVRHPVPRAARARAARDPELGRVLGTGRRRSSRPRWSWPWSRRARGT